MKNLFQMLINRNENIKTLMDVRQNTITDKPDNYNNIESLRNTSKVIVPDMSYFYTIYTSKYPFSLKNLCRITIKNSMRKYTRKNIEQLALPTNLKRFLYYEAEIERTISQVLNETYS
jgi:hypothetical protein